MKRRLFLCVLCCGLLSLPLSSQSQSSSVLASLPPFDDSRVYSVSGADLNAWAAYSRMQDEALRTAEIRLKIVEDQLEKSDAYFKTAFELVKESQRLFNEYKLRTEIELWLERILTVSLAVAYAVK